MSEPQFMEHPEFTGDPAVGVVELEDED